MNKSIRTYDDLVAYQSSLQHELRVQKKLIYEDIHDIREELRPLQESIRTVGKFFVPSEDHSLLVRGTNTVLDLLLRNVFFKKSSWLTRTIVPFIAHNISSHLVSDNKNGIFKKILSLLPKGKRNKEQD
jgi:hypothetical protein